MAGDDLSDTLRLRLPRSDDFDPGILRAKFFKPGLMCLKVDWADPRRL